MARGRYRRHSPQFKLQLCSDIRTGVMGRRDAPGITAKVLENPYKGLN